MQASGNLPPVINLSHFGKIQDYIFESSLISKISFVEVIIALKEKQFLGLCGNSGKSTLAHIHYHLQNTPFKKKDEELPAQFTNYSTNAKLQEKGHPKKG